MDLATTLSHRIANHTARITIVGQGYVGLPLAVEFARIGFPVIGLDTDPDRVAALVSGRSHVPDVPSEHLQALLQVGRYYATTQSTVLSESDAVLICVPTPLRKSKDPDISYVVAAAKQAAARSRPGQLIILESTTYPGTTEELLMPLFQANGARIGEDVFLAFSPGPGIGGHCIPVDPLYLSWKMRLNGYEARFISLADEINRAMPTHVLGLVSEALNEAGRALKGTRILVLGVAYKGGIGDTRESPAYEIIATLLRKGAHVSYADPHVPTFMADGTELKAVEPTAKELRTAHCVLILADHREFDYGAVARHRRLIVVTRHSVPAAATARGRLVRL